ncbi:preprotein translocase subunit SecG [Candidatus Sumerlaeota bacterium]
MGMVILGILFIIYMAACLLLIVVVLAQEGKGGGISGLISGGAGGALTDSLGASGGEAFYRRWTKIMAFIFLSFSLGLTLVGRKVLIDDGDGSVLNNMPEEQFATPTPTTTAPPVDEQPEQLDLGDAPAGPATETPATTGTDAATDSSTGADTAPGEESEVTTGS